MTIETPDTVDIVAVGNGSAQLFITDHLEWEPEEYSSHLRLIQSKIHLYQDFIESKQLYEKYPEAEGLKIEIIVAGLQPFPDACLWFVERWRELLGEQNIGFKIEHRGELEDGPSPQPTVH